MSFFVSKSLEGIVDENCLIPSEENDTLNKEFVLVINDFVFSVQELNFLKDFLEIALECNIHAVDTLFLNKASLGKIKLKNSTIEIKDLNISNIFKKEEDNYIVRLTAGYTF